MTNETVVTETTNVVAAVGTKLVAGLQTQVVESKTAVSRLGAWLADKGADFLVNALAALVILLLGWLAIRLVSAAVDRALTRNGKRRTLFTAFVSSVVSKSLWAFLAVTVLGRLGVNVGPLVAGLGVTGFILGFAFQESLGNLASGLMISLNEPFRVGDFIEAAGLSGTVMEMNMIATVLTTPDNKKLVVPNKNVWGGPITNYTALGRRRLEIQVGIAYAEDIARASAVALAAVAKVPGALADPAPTVVPVSFDDSAVTLAVRAWATVADYWAVHAAVFLAVKSAFDANGVSIPFPQLDIHTEARG